MTKCKDFVLIFSSPAKKRSCNGGFSPNAGARNLISGTIFQIGQDEERWRKGRARDGNRRTQTATNSLGLAHDMKNSQTRKA